MPEGKTFNNFNLGYSNYLPNSATKYMKSCLAPTTQSISSGIMERYTQWCAESQSTMLETMSISMTGMIVFVMGACILEWADTAPAYSASSAAVDRRRFRVQSQPSVSAEVAISYTETIRLVYSRPTFIFHNYYTQLLFSASVISQSFHSIRSIRIMPANEPYHGHSSRANAWEASYRFLRHRGIVVRNPDVPKIPAQPRWYDLSDSKEKQSQQEPVDPFNVWQHIFLIMRAMQGLRKFRLDAKDDQHLLQTHLAGPAAGTFWLQMKNFAQSRVFDKGFDIVFWPSTGPVQVCVGEELEDLGVVRRRNEKVTAD
jgi:hypothetical protein